MNVSFIRNLLPAIVVAAALAGRAEAENGFCAHCGCQAECRKVCRLVCEEKKVEVFCWGCKCEEFCVPCHSKTGCQHCETVCDDCEKCEPGVPQSEPKRFVSGRRETLYTHKADAKVGKCHGAQLQMGRGRHVPRLHGKVRCQACPARRGDAVVCRFASATLVSFSSLRRVAGLEIVGEADAPAVDQTVAQVASQGCVAVGQHVIELHLHVQIEKPIQSAR